MKIANKIIWGISLEERRKRLIRNAGGVASKVGKKVRVDWVYDPKTFDLARPSKSVVLKIISAEDFDKAREWIFCSGDKKRAPEINWPLNFVNRPLGRIMLRYVARIAWVSPTSVTAMGVGLLIAASSLIASGERLPMMAGGLLVQFAHSLDCVDGRLSRLRLESSTLGEYLDSFGDFVKLGSLYLAMALGSYRQTGSEYYLIIGLVVLLAEYLNSGQILIGQNIQVTTMGTDTSTTKRNSTPLPLRIYFVMRNYLSFYENRLMLVSIAGLTGVIPFLLIGFGVFFNLFWIGGLVFTFLNRKYVRKVA